MTPPSGAPPSSAVMFPELLGTAEPAPPARTRASKLLRTLARVVLWSLVALGALRGFVPASTAPPDPSRVTDPRDPRAEAVAAAFMREYLTVGSDRATRVERLGRFAVKGLDLDRSVVLPAGVAQYVDLVVVSGSRRVDGGVEATVLAHVLQIRSGTYHDGGTLSFAVPMAVRREGVAVRGRPRPIPLPVASGLSLGRSRGAPADQAQTATQVARQAAIAPVAADRAILAGLRDGGAAWIPFRLARRATALGGG